MEEGLEPSRIGRIRATQVLLEETTMLIIRETEMAVKILRGTITTSSSLGTRDKPLPTIPTTMDLSQPQLESLTSAH